MSACRHVARPLFKEAKHSERLRFAQVRRQHSFVECEKCGCVGYSGAHRMRWGCIMADKIRADAAEWNAIVEREDIPDLRRAASVLNKGRGVGR